MTPLHRTLRVFAGLTALPVFLAAITVSNTAKASTYVWNVSVPGLNDWNVPGNWNLNNGNSPGPGDAAVFGYVGTNTTEAVNNIVSVNTTIGSLTYTNTATNSWHVTDIQPGVTLTVTNTLIVGGMTNFPIITSVGFVDAGTLSVGGSLTVGNNGGSTSADQNTTLDMSGLSNFVYNASNATFSIGLGNRSAANFKFAAASNFVQVATWNADATSSSSGVSGAVTLGAGTNTIWVNSLNTADNRDSCTIEFPSTGGGLMMRGVGGDPARTTLVMGNRNENTSGGNDTAVMNFNGNAVDMKFGTITLGQATSATPSGDQQGNGTISFDTGVINATNINMAISGATNHNSANGVMNVGAHATLIVSNNISLVNQGFAAPNAVSTGTLNVTNGGVVNCSGNIIKTTAGGTGTVSITTGTLTMSSPTGVVGTPGAPIDNFTIASATLNLNVANNLTNIVTATFNAQDNASVVNITALPAIFDLPTSLPLITYTSFPDSGSISLGTMPGTFSGYVTNDSTAETVFLVITNGPVTAKIDQWSGANGTTWDTVTPNWTNVNNGAFIAYSENDVVLFNDFAQTGNVTFSENHTTPIITFSNNVINYTLSGTGSISNGVSLSAAGTGTVKLAESGGDTINGSITVDGGGVLVLDDANNTNTAGVTISSGSTVQIGNNDANVGPPSGGFTDNGTLNFEKTDAVTISNAISGNGAVNQMGTGVLTLAANNSSYSGNVTVSAGTLALVGSGTLSNAIGVTIGTGVVSPTFNISGVSSGLATLSTLNLDNAVLTLGTTNQTAPLTVSGSMNMSGSGNTINVTALPPMASFPTTVTLVQSANTINGYNGNLGTLPGGFSGILTNNTSINAIQLIVTSGTVSQRPFVLWTGADLANATTPDTNWSDNANWQLPGEPVAGDTVFFGGPGTSSSSALNTPGGGINSLNGNIDNIVDSDFTISSLTFTNIGGAYHNTFINPGNTLSVTNSGGLTIGAIDTGSTASTEFVTVIGTNATLSVDNTNANLQIWLGDVSGSQATLDLSGLDTFSLTNGRLAVGASINNTVNRPSGILYLAKTNTITSVFQTTTEDAGTTTANSAIVVADCDANAGSTSSLFLGLANTITADTIGIGRQKASGVVQFNTIYANVAPYPTATIQGFSANSVSVLEVGNGVGNTGTTTLTGTMDLTGGIVTGAASNLFVGHASSGGGSGNTTGILSFDAGTLNVNALNIGLQPSSGTKEGIGTVNVSSNTVIGMPAVLNVSGPINIGFAAGGNATPATGTVNVTNGTVAANSIVAGTNGGASTVNLVGGRLIVATTIGSTGSPLGALNFAPLGTSDNSNTVLQVPASLTANVIVSNLTIDGQASTTNVLNISSLPAGVTVGEEIPVIAYTNFTVTDGVTNIGLGTLPSNYAGYLTNDTSSNTIAVVLTTVPVAAPTKSAEITHISLSGTNLIIQGTNNNVPNTSFRYAVLTSTNVALPLSEWTLVVTNPFNGDGTFDYTNPVVPGAPRQFIDVKAVP